MEQEFSEFSEFRELMNHWSMNCSQFKDYVPCWHCGSILVLNIRGGCVAGLSHFAIMTNIFVTEFAEFSENI